MIMQNSGECASLPFWLHMIKPPSALSDTPKNCTISFIDGSLEVGRITPMYGKCLSTIAKYDVNLLEGFTIQSFVVSSLRSY